MQARHLETVLLSAAGQLGISGTQAWSGNNNREGRLSSHVFHGSKLQELLYERLMGGWARDKRFRNFQMGLWLTCTQHHRVYLEDMAKMRQYPLLALMRTIYASD